MRVAGAGAGPPEGRVGAGPVEADPADGGVGLFLASRVGRGGGGREGGREKVREGVFSREGKKKSARGGKKKWSRRKKKRSHRPSQLRGAKEFQSALSSEARAPGSIFLSSANDQNNRKSSTKVNMDRKEEKATPKARL